MKILLGILIALSTILIGIFTRLITTFFHELGHAIPALLFTKGEVKMYVGSYGNTDKSLQIKLGRFTAYLKINLFEWNLGLCTHQSAVNIVQNIIIILGGPLMSVLLGTSLFFLLLSNAFADWILVIAGLFMLSTIWDFIVNMVPLKAPSLTQDGATIHSDGYQLVENIQYLIYPPNYLQAAHYFQGKDYEKAANLYQELLNEGHQKTKIYLQYASCLYALKSYKKAIAIMNTAAQKKPWNFEANLLVGRIYMGMSNYENALKALDQAIYYQYNHAEALRLRGQTLLALREYQHAKRDFDALLAQSTNFAKDYVDRAHIYLNLQAEEAAFKDLQKAIALDDKNAYAYFYLGAYYEQLQQNKAALAAYKKAKTLGIEHHGIDFLIAKYS